MLAVPGGLRTFTTERTEKNLGIFFGYHYIIIRLYDWCSTVSAIDPTLA